MSDTTPSYAYARETWQTMEPFHGAVYFSPETNVAYADLGVR